MADIGVLSLQIHSESTQAENSLRRLEGALLAVKTAVNNSGLGKTVGALKRLKDAVDINMITNLNGLAAAMKKVQEACNFTVPSMSGLRSVQRAMSSVGNSGASIREVQESVAGISDGFATMGQAIDPAVDHVKTFIESLNKPIDYSNLSKFVDNMAGIGRETKITQQEVDVFATDASRQIGNLMSYLEKPVSYKGLSNVVDIMTGVSRHFVSTADDWKELSSQINNGIGLSGMKEAASAMETVTSETASAKAAAMDFSNAISQEEYRQKALQMQTQMVAHDMERLAAIQKEWASMSDDRKAYVMDLYKDNPRMSEALSQMDDMIAASKAVQESTPAVETAMQKVSAKTGEVASTVRGQAVPALKDLDRELKQKKTDAQNATNAFERFKAGLHHIKSGVGTLFSPLTKLGKQIWNIGKRMAIRAVIRQFTQGLREGIENVYNYSKAIGASFAPSMDEAATALQQMKNSLGAAVAPAIQALIPILQSVVNWLISGLNYLNQFFALLNGQKSWTRAIPATTTAFGKQEKAAKGAAAAVKDLLADWDELNIIQSETSGSGVGLTDNNAEDVLNMFEQVEEYDSRIRDLVGFIKDNFDDIKTVALAIGTSILAWKLSTAFIGDLGLLQHISIAAGAALIISGIKIGYESGMQVGYTDGEDKDSVTKAILSTAATALGGTLVGLGVAGATGAVVGGIAGLGIGLLVTVAGIINGIALRKSEGLEAHARAAIAAEKKRWGGQDFTGESIKQYIEDQLSMEVTPKVEVLTPYVEGFGSALKTIDEETQKFSTLANKRSIEIKLGIASTVSKDDLINQANTTIDALNAAQDSGLSALAVAFEVVPPKADDGSLLNVDELLGNIKIGNQAAVDYMKELGRKMGEALSSGTAEGMAQDSEALAMKYANEMLLIETRSEQLYQEYKLRTELGGPTDFQNMSLDSALKMAQNQEQIWAERKQEFTDSRLQLADSLAKLMADQQAKLESARRTNENGENDATIAALEASVAAYEEAIKQLKDVDTAWNEIAGDTYEQMRNAWIDLLKSKGILETDAGNYIGILEDWKSTISGVLNEGGTVTAFAGTIRNLVEGALENGWTIPLGTSQGEKVKAWVDQTYDIGGLEGVEDKTAVIDYIKETFGEENIAGVLWLMGENQEAITKILEEYYGSDNFDNAEEQREETYDQQKGAGEALGETLGDLVKNGLRSLLNLNESTGTKGGSFADAVINTLKSWFGPKTSDTENPVKNAVESIQTVSETSMENIENEGIEVLKDVKEVVQQANQPKNGLDELLEKYNYSMKSYFDLLGKVENKYKNGTSLEGLNGMLGNYGYPQEIIDYILDYISGGKFTQSDQDDDDYDTAYWGIPPTETVTVEDVELPPGMFGGEETDMSADVEKGTNAANGNHWTTIEGLIRRLILEMPKEIKISPTSNWGLFNRTANEAASAVTGDNP